MSRRGGARWLLALCVVGLAGLVAQGLRQPLSPPAAPGRVAVALAAAPEAAALADALAPQNPSRVRVWAAELLGELQGSAGRDARPLLRAALDDPDPAVRAAVRRSLGSGE